MCVCVCVVSVSCVDKSFGGLFTCSNSRVQALLAVNAVSFGWLLRSAFHVAIGERALNVRLEFNMMNRATCSSNRLLLHIQKFRCHHGALMRGSARSATSGMKMLISMYDVSR